MTTQASTAEFDAFGPWIDEVRSPYEVPRLFTLHPIDFATTRLVLKVPRNISRRDANPTMDLYDHLIIAGEHELTLLSRDGTMMRSTTMAYDRIAAISDAVALLDAELTIVGSDGHTVRFAYNGSGNGAIVRLIELLRALVNPGAITMGPDSSNPDGAGPASTGPASTGPAIAPPRSPYASSGPGIDDLGRGDSVLVTWFRDLERMDASLDFRAGHGSAPVTPRSGTVTDWLRPSAVSGVLVAASPSELQVISRRAPIVRRSAVDHSRRRTIVFRGGIHSSHSAPHSHFAGLAVVALQVGSTGVEFTTLQGSEVERELLALGRS
jgi:hypothetical protein